MSLGKSKKDGQSFFLYTTSPHLQDDDAAEEDSLIRVAEESPRIQMLRVEDPERVEDGKERRPPGDRQHHHVRHHVAEAVDRLFERLEALEIAAVSEVGWWC